MSATRRPPRPRQPPHPEVTFSEPGPAPAPEPTPHRFGADDLLAAARRKLRRVEPEQADRLRRDGALLVDIRPHHNRLAEGEIPDSLVVERIVLEWRLDPHGEHRIRRFTVAGQDVELTEDTPVVVLCNEGYASSLAARDLRRLGLRQATDLVGGYRAWRAAGLPVREGGTQPVT
jgi:rhodanese-related sulfurtransferase